MYTSIVAIAYGTIEYNQTTNTHKYRFVEFDRPGKILNSNGIFFNSLSDEVIENRLHVIDPIT